MAAPARRIGRAKDDPVTCLPRGAGHGRVHREFRNLRAVGAIKVAGPGLAVVMAQHRGPGLPCTRARLGDRGGNLGAAFPHRLDQRDEIRRRHARAAGAGLHLSGKIGTVHVGHGQSRVMVEGAGLQRAIGMQDTHRRVVIEGKRWQQWPRQSAVDQGKGLEAEGLPPQLDAVFDRETRREGGERGHHLFADAD